MRKQGVVMFDLDDTLVDKESIYVEAQSTLLRRLATKEPLLAFNKQNFEALRRIDLELVQLNRGVHWYESWKLAEALWLLRHNGKSEHEAAVLASEAQSSDLENLLIFEAAGRHDKILRNAMPKLFGNAIGVLTELRERYVLVLVSCGKEEPQMKVIRHNKLDKMFDAIIICDIKDKETYLKAKKIGEEKLSTFGGEARRMVMVGDRISQDIKPSKAAGLETIWIPGQYGQDPPEICPPDHEVKGLIEVREILLTDREKQV